MKQKLGNWIPMAFCAARGSCWSVRSCRSQSEAWRNIEPGSGERHSVCGRVRSHYGRRFFCVLQCFRRQCLGHWILQFADHPAQRGRDIFIC
jgi:hypothetical protein